MSEIEFDTPANRIIKQFSPEDRFGINTSLPDISFLRQLSIQGRLITKHGFTSGTEQMITIKPATGTTLFVYNLTLYADSASAITTFQVTWGIPSNPEVRLRVSLRDTFPSYDSPYFDSFVGDGTRLFIVEPAASVTGNKSTTLLGWTENTSRIRDVG